MRHTGRCPQVRQRRHHPGAGPPGALRQREQHLYQLRHPLREDPGDPLRLLLLRYVENWVEGTEELEALRKAFG